MGRLLATLYLASALALPAGASTYTSAFGFTLTVPDSWLALTRDQLASHPDLLNPSNSKLPSVDPKALADLRTKIEAGTVEIFLRPAQDQTFTDNISILRQKSPAPQSDAELTAMCSALPTRLAKRAGRPIAVSSCMFANSGAGKSLYIEYDGFVPGTTVMQYQLPRPSGATVVITATVKSSELGTLRPEFKSVVGSIREE
ncbi:MAG: hypothetical protein ACM3O7_04510 [Acidobacteriota bacterium]